MLIYLIMCKCFHSCAICMTICWAHPSGRLILKLFWRASHKSEPSWTFWCRRSTQESDRWCPPLCSLSACVSLFRSSPISRWPPRYSQAKCRRWLRCWFFTPALSSKASSSFAWRTLDRNSPTRYILLPFNMLMITHCRRQEDNYYSTQSQQLISFCHRS